MKRLEVDTWRDFPSTWVCRGKNVVRHYSPSPSSWKRIIILFKNNPHRVNTSYGVLGFTTSVSFEWVEDATVVAI